MPDPATWLSELSLVAPRTDRTALRIIARLLADTQNADVLLLVSDALAEAARGFMIESRPRDAAEMIALGGLIGAHVQRRRGSF